ncbi:MAG: HAD family phosphatase [Akkermansiaceae bacterium]|nr:HAD family phosphatase [Akkermansiaceae bacterium]
MSVRVTLPEKTYAGYIFDLDGTLVDSMPVHFKAWRWALREHGAPPEVFRWEEFVAHGGMAAPDIVADLNATYGLSMEPEIVADDKRNRYAWLLENETLPVIPETINLVRRLKEQGIPYAIGTGSMPSGALETLLSAGVADLFSIMVTPADVPPGFGKPRPDIFLLCAERMGVNPAECVVFEDAEPGIQAALAGGMDYVRVGECPPVRD